MGLMTSDHGKHVKYDIDVKMSTFKCQMRSNLCINKCQSRNHDQLQTKPFLNFTCTSPPHTLQPKVKSESMQIQFDPVLCCGISGDQFG